MPTQTARLDPRAIAAELVNWYAQHARDYPWRRTRDAYAILVSEVMLQQTQITTVLDRGFYARWMEKFPDFKTLAAAKEEEVLKAWEGLGYYRRARNLQKLAREVMERHGGVFPCEPAAILALPGVGPYTAGAVASFAFGLAEPIVDGNIARVLSRLHDDATPVDSTAGAKVLWERSRALVEATDDPRALNSALMELGQTHCSPTKPACDLCPVRAYCRAKEPEALPVKQMRQEITPVTERVIFLRTAEGVLLEQETGKRRTGLWKLPALPAEHEDAPPKVLVRAQYGITRYKVTLWVHEPHKQAGQWPETHRFIATEELESTPMPAPYRKVLQQLLTGGEFRLSA
ncbi:A/G-specific adenine glycosylase [Prosthecobacter vanneervenii]|uniref:Adenine DNA glycosylase n=1 Tax=Prosthecobacter vanneervenii TaxID=48466 RepID=A0A7W8DLZ7_9BACT|nr:A/G-specific adenine glycosylase [Prosthecobacter vanneervenii]MBB5034371.1 A/G-specific adenine glycosylase [Prosthecobacter vanneervenii]